MERSSVGWVEGDRLPSEDTVVVIGRDDEPGGIVVERDRSRWRGEICGGLVYRQKT